MSKPSRESLLGLVVVATLVLSACGERGSSPGAQSATTASPAASQSPGGQGAEEVRIYLLREDDDPYSKDSYVAVTRRVADESAEGRLRAALQELLKGPTPQEREEGLVSVFSEETAGMLRAVELSAEGAAVVDLADVRQEIPEGATSQAGAVMMVQLNQTVFGFPEASSVEYRLEGSCDRFWEWQQSVCHVIDRDEWGSGTNPLSDDT